MRTGPGGVALLLAALVAPAPLAAAGSPGPSRLVQKLGAAERGRPLPSFAGWTPEGELLTLGRALAPPRKAARRALVVSFFGTWCGPCREQLPSLARAVAADQGGAVGTLLVHVGEPDQPVRDWLAPLGLRDAPVILDPFAKIADRLGVGKALPRTLVLDGAGTVVAIFEREGEDYGVLLAERIALARGER